MQQPASRSLPPGTVIAGAWRVERDMLALYLRSFFLLLAMLLALASPAGAQKRVALVIGNAAYKETMALTNTRNDATDMVAVLKRLGFEVLDGLDLDKRGMERLIRQFEQKLDGAEIGMFFYAGHGIQVAGQNHLVPIDARLAAEGDIDFESLPLSLVLSRMERKVKTSLVLLDACRDNPLARNLARNMGTRGATIGQGLAEVKTGIGTLISFSTQPGNVALDGAGRNSPYTTALLAEIEVPGRDILSALAAVRGTVVKTTAGKQVPWEHTSLLGPVVLKAAPAAQSAPPLQRQPDPTVAALDTVRVCREVEGMTSLTTLAVLERQYKGTPAGDCVTARVNEIKAAQTAAKEAEDRARADATAKKKAEDEAKTKQAAFEAKAREEARRRDPIAALVPGSGQAARDCWQGSSGPCGPVMVAVPAGEFMMGTSDDEIAALKKGYPASADFFDKEAGQHRVKIPRPFAAGRSPVTRGEFAAFVRDGGRKVDPGCWTFTTKWEQRADATWQAPGFEQTDDHPVVCVNWEDAKAYAAWLSGKTGKSYRLLSEAEAEYVIRGITRPSDPHPRWWFGNDAKDLCANANGADQTAAKQFNWDLKTVAPCPDGFAYTSPVASFRPNAFGIYDAAGNA